MLPPPSTEQRGRCDSRKILPGSKKGNKNHHPAACGAILGALLPLPFQPGFTSAVTVPRSVRWRGHLSHMLRTATRSRMEAFYPSPPPGGERHRMFRASPESCPGDFSGNRQPAATSLVGEVLSWQAALQRHTQDVWLKGPCSSLAPQSRAHDAALVNGSKQVSGALRQECGKDLHGPWPIGVASDSVPSCLC